MSKSTSYLGGQKKKRQPRRTFKELQAVRASVTVNVNERNRRQKEHSLGWKEKNTGAHKDSSNK